MKGGREGGREGGERVREGAREGGARAKLGFPPSSPPSLPLILFKTLNKIFDRSKISNTLTIITFNAYVASVFLYNSELGTLTKKTGKYSQHFPKETSQENPRHTLA